MVLCPETNTCSRVRSPSQLFRNRQHTSLNCTLHSGRTSLQKTAHHLRRLELYTASEGASGITVGETAIWNGSISHESANCTRGVIQSGFTFSPQPPVVGVDVCTNLDGPVCAFPGRIGSTDQASTQRATIWLVIRDKVGVASVSAVDLSGVVITHSAHKHFISCTFKRCATEPYIQFTLTNYMELRSNTARLVRDALQSLQTSVLYSMGRVAAGIGSRTQPCMRTLRGQPCCTRPWPSSCCWGTCG